jgi:hypothetical protein
MRKPGLIRWIDGLESLWFAGVWGARPPLTSNTLAYAPFKSNESRMGPQPSTWQKASRMTLRTAVTFLTASQRCCSPNVPMRIPAIFRELVVYRTLFPRELSWTETLWTLVMLRLVSLACRICYVTIQIPQTLFQYQLMRFYITTRFGTVTKKVGIMTVLVLNRAWMLLSQRPSSSKIFSLVGFEWPIDAIANIIVDVRRESCDTSYIVCLRLRLAGGFTGSCHLSRILYRKVILSLDRSPETFGRALPSSGRSVDLWPSSFSEKEMVRYFTNQYSSTQRSAGRKSVLVDPLSRRLSRHGRCQQLCRDRSGESSLQFDLRGMEIGAEY